MHQKKVRSGHAHAGGGLARHEGAKVYDVKVGNWRDQRGVEQKHVVAFGNSGAGELLREAAASGQAELVQLLVTNGTPAAAASHTCTRTCFT